MEEDKFDNLCYRKHNNATKTINVINVEHGSIVLKEQSFCQHLKNPNRVKTEGIWVLYRLSVENKIHRVTICNALLFRLGRDPVLQQIVTRDEKWILHSNPQKKKQ